MSINIINQCINRSKRLNITAYIYELMKTINQIKLQYTPTLANFLFGCLPNRLNKEKVSERKTPLHTTSNGVLLLSYIYFKYCKYIILAEKIK